MIAGTLGIIEVRETNPIIKKIVGDPEVANYKIDLSISTKALNIIYADPKDKERLNRLIARHSIELVSFAAQGSEETNTSDMFGYIAKKRNGTDRRCHIFRFKD
ncbi:hypothetical protein OESDEN_25252, partial [Oesophagostomum dentatum]